MIRILLFALAAMVSSTTISAQTDTTATRTTEIRAAAVAFLETLTGEQRAVAQLRFDDPARVDWHYIPKRRKGLALKDMNPDQRKAAMKMFRAAMSSTGYAKAEMVIELEKIIHAVEGGEMRDPQRYHFTVYGDPASTGSECWGVSIEGHHLSCNLTLRGEGVVCATPLFIGANPAVVLKAFGVGPPQGTSTLKTEEDLGYELLNSLSDQQRTIAVVAATSPRDMNEGGKPQTKDPGRRTGLAASQMDEKQQTILLKLIGEFISNAPDGFATETMTNIEKQLNEVSFSWYGPLTRPAQHSYRIEGADVVLMLFNTQADAAGTPVNHIHTIWRTPGRDFSCN